MSEPITSLWRRLADRLQGNLHGITGGLMGAQPVAAVVRVKRTRSMWRSTNANGHVATTCQRESTAVASCCCAQTLDLHAHRAYVW